MDITIRDAQPKDSAAVVHLIAELAATAEERSPVTEAYVRRYLSSSRSRALLAELEGDVVGLLRSSIRPDLYHAADACLIEELVVQETARGQGVGSALLTELLSRLGSSGCAEVSVAAMPDNIRAIRFYRAHGLVEEAVFLETHFGSQNDKGQGGK
jgi:ribosomal protein S18 acetylase RimI-like enzyme